MKLIDEYNARQIDPLPHSLIGPFVGGHAHQWGFLDGPIVRHADMLVTALDTLGHSTSGERDGFNTENYSGPN